MRRVDFDKNMSYNLIEHMYHSGVYNIEDVIVYVNMGNITEEEFHSITGYDYNGMKFLLRK